MNEWTEQEEQQIIERAKTGDPEANYALSLWALRRGEEEPEEPRWNRLAAKCLVKAAQAGYGPAKEQLNALLSQDAQASSSKPKPTSTRRSAPPAQEEPQQDEAEDEDGPAGQPAPQKRSVPSRRSGHSAPQRRTPSRRPTPADQEEDEGFDVDQASWDDGEDEDDARPARRSGGSRLAASLKRGGGARGGQKWGDGQWRKLEVVCVCVCAALLVVIATMILTSRHKDSGTGSGGSAIPPAGEVASADGQSGGAVSDYPDEATRSAIMAADLDIQPSPEDYVAQATTGTVSVSSEYLRLRKGPNTTYEPIAQMPNGTSVSVFATKNDWDLILYQGDDGPIYGWCSSEYVILTAGGAEGASGTAAPTDDPGDSVG